ncbi:MAG: acetylxylan esterase, partial [Acidobacteria bacterium]|nr:acetylxylan esterase [Acidobacteriota bacterium]
MNEAGDRLSLAYNTFVSDLEVDPPSERRLAFRFLVTRKGRPEEAQLTLQLVLKPGEALETGGGRHVLLGKERIVLGPEQLGGWIRHHGWTLKVDAGSQLTWPVYPYYPYANGPETELEQAVGALSTPLRLKAGSNERTQEIAFTLEESGPAAKLAAAQEEQWRSEIKSSLFVPDPLPPLDPQVHGSFEPIPGVIAERVTYGTQFGMRIPAILYRPKSLSRRVPGLIVVNGHGGDKYSWYAFYSGMLYARAGAVVLTYDPAGEGERNANRKSGTRAHDKFEPPPELARRLAGLMMTDILQAVSYLRQRPEVDPQHLAAFGYSMGSFILSLTGAVERRLNACVLVGGGNLDGPGGEWERSKPMCQAIPYRSLTFLGDRPAVIYALHASRGPTLVFNGREDGTVHIPKPAEPFFEDLQRRVADLRGSTQGIFETGFVDGVGHRPFFVTKPVALWLERRLDFLNWTEESIQAMPETHISEWARRHGVELDPLYASEEREGGAMA